MTRGRLRFGAGLSFTAHSHVQFPQRGPVSHPQVHVQFPLPQQQASMLTSFRWTPGS